MHYKNGQPARLGDQVVYQSNGLAKTGVVIKCVPGAETCNLMVAPLERFDYVTAKNCLHIEAAMSATDVMAPEQPKD